VKRSIVFFTIPFVLLTWFSFVIFQKACDDAMQVDAAKAIPFMHKTHVEKYGASDCETCHKYDDNGRFLGIPTIGECTACHDRNGELAGNDPLTPKKKQMFDSYKDTDRPWTSWAKQPDLVYFSHKVVMTAKYEDGKLKARCESCHGDKANSTDMAMINGKMPMGQCMDCHTALKISNACAVCHD